MDVLEVGLDDPPGRARYDRLFESCPGAFIQQSSDWAQAIQGLGPDLPILLLCHDGRDDIAGLPLYLFEAPSGNILTSVPQAGPLGGVFVRPGLEAPRTEDAYACLLERAAGIARERSCLSLTLITSPFLDDLPLYERSLDSPLVFENFTQFIPLDGAVDGDRILLRDANRRSNLSRNLRRAKDAGFTVEPAEGDEDLLAWYKVHERRHRELGATPLPFELVSSLLRVLGPRGKARLLLVRRGRKIASGCLYVLHRDILDVFMLSMDSAYVEDAPNFLNTEASLVWAGAVGVRTYNWQSSPGRATGVYRYKQQWGSREAPYYFVTQLLSPPDVFLRLGKEGIAARYPGHYVVPFAALDAGFSARRFRKE